MIYELRVYRCLPGRLPALIRRFHEAMRDGSNRVVIWGTGAPRREFLHVDDLADAVAKAVLK